MEFLPNRTPQLVVAYRHLETVGLAKASFSTPAKAQIYDTYRELEHSTCWIALKTPVLDSQRSTSGDLLF